MPSNRARNVTSQILARSERDAREAVFPDLRNVGILARALVLYIAMVTAYVISITARPIDLLLNLSIALAESLPVAASVGAAALVLLASVFGSGAITAAVKLLVSRDRPSLPLAIDSAEQGFSFPSGHSLSSLALYGSLAYLLAQGLRSWRRVAVVAGLLTVVVAVGASRVYLGYHWVSDVLGSWTLGVLWLSAVLTAERILTARRVVAPDLVPQGRPVGAAAP